MNKEEIMGAVIHLENVNERIVCPYRTTTITTQLDEISVESTVTFPECQYALCPFYDVEQKNIKDRCLRTYTEINAYLYGNDTNN